MAVPTTSSAPPKGQKKSDGVVKGVSVRAAAMAGPFDGGKTMLCANQYASECDAGTDCKMVMTAAGDGFAVVVFGASTLR